MNPLSTNRPDVTAGRVQTPATTTKGGEHVPVQHPTTTSDSAETQRKRRRNHHHNWSGRAGKKKAVVVPAPPPVVMSPSELTEWSHFYKAPRLLEQYLRNEADDPEYLLDKFYSPLAKLMFHQFDAAFYHTCYGEYYCWTQRKLDSGKDFDFDNGCRLYLQIKDVHGVWQDYLYLQTSKFGHGLGMFTARAFPKGALLGLYMGPRVWSADLVGTAEPSSEYLQHQNGIDQASPCLCHVRDKQGRLHLHNPERVHPKNMSNPAEELFMGFHYSKGMEESYVNVNKPNCEIMEDGAVMSHFALSADEELVCGVLVD